jgi:hypothetical protein
MPLDELPNDCLGRHYNTDRRSPIKQPRRHSVEVVVSAYGLGQDVPVAMS